MNSLLVYPVAFLVVLTVLIVVHEAGHYVVARWAGVKVLRFSLGFGRTIWQRRLGRDETEWAIGVFPLGGYVKMLDEREGSVAPHEVHRCFNRQRVGIRMLIVAAGPVANLLLAVVLYWGLFITGVEELRPIVGTPVVATPVSMAGFQDGELVRKVAGESIQTWQDMRWVLLKRAIDDDIIEFEVINRRDEISIRRLDVSSIRGEWGADAIDSLGFSYFHPRIAPVVGKITPESVAALAGLLPDDEIVSINGVQIASWQELVEIVRNSPGKPLDFALRRAGSVVRSTLMPAAVIENGVSIGRIGAAVKSDSRVRDELLVVVRYDIVSAFARAIDETWDKSVFSLVTIGKMFMGEISWRNISGPVTIADYAGQSARLGLPYYIKFMALISISLAVLNLLPVPILDGGHLLYYLLEILRGRPLPERGVEIAQQIGLGFLLMLMAFALYNDFNRLFSG